jgi:hypothetical protein
MPLPAQLPKKKHSDKHPSQHNRDVTMSLGEPLFPGLGCRVEMKGRRRTGKRATQEHKAQR